MKMFNKFRAKRRKRSEKDLFHDFVTTYSSEQKEKLMTEAVRKANKEQKEIVETYLPNKNRQSFNKI